MSDEKTDFDFPYKLLINIGLWAFEGKNETIRKYYWIYQSWWLLFLFVFFGLCLCDLVMFITDVQRASTNLSTTVSVFMFLWKLFVAFKYFHRIQQLRKDLKSGLHAKSDSVDRQILLEGEKQLKYSCCLLFFLAGSTVSLWLFSPFIVQNPGEENLLPLPVYIPWNYSRSPFYFMAYFYQGFGTYLVAFNVVSINFTVFGTILHICAEYNILMKNIRKMNKWCESFCWRWGQARQLTEKENFHVKKMIVDNIRHHQKIIKCVDEAERCYVHMMLVQFSGSACLITVVTLDLILVILQVTIQINSRLVTLIVFFNLVSLDISLFCLFGSKLIAKSSELLTCLSDVPWETLNGSNRKMISLFILKAQRPPKLTIEKVASMDWYTMLRMIKVIYNVLYLLLHVARKKET